MLVAMTYKLLAEVSNGELATGFDTGLKLDSNADLFMGGQIVWIVVLAGLGGALGASYNLIVLFVNQVRMRCITNLDKIGRRAVQVGEVVGVSLVIFSLYFLVPLTLPCTPCPPRTNLSAVDIVVGGGAHGSTHGAGLGGCVYSGHRSHVRHACADGEYSELATLLLSGQEGMVRAHGSPTNRAPRG